MWSRTPLWSRYALQQMGYLPFVQAHICNQAFQVTSSSTTCDCQKVSTKNEQRIATYIVMAITFGWGLLAFTVTWAFCVPIAFNWNKEIPGGHCANVDVGFLIVGIVDATTDFMILILPMPMIWRLKGLD